MARAQSNEPTEENRVHPCKKEFRGELFFHRFIKIDAFIPNLRTDFENGCIAVYFLLILIRLRLPHLKN